MKDSDCLDITKTSGRLILLLWLMLITALAYVPPVKAGVAVDPNFHAPYFADAELASRAALLPNGKYVLFFNAFTLTDQPTGPIMRFNSDGTLDTSFSFSRDYAGVVSVAPLSNGQLLVDAGIPPVYGVFGGEQILLLNTDGSIDPSFNSGAQADSNVRAITTQPDGKILAAGFFDNFAGAPRQKIVRLLPDGTVDPGFASLQITAPGGGIWAEPAFQSDDKILIVGDFTAVNAVARPGIARLNADGTFDASFVPSGFTRNRPIRGVVVQADGKVVIGGKFTVGPTSEIALLRLNSDGSLDSTYSVPAGLSSLPTQIRKLALQADGKVIAVGKSVFRFNTDGSLDSTFRQPLLLINRSTTSPALPPEAFTVDIQTNSQILIGGLFTDIDDATGPSNGLRFCVARLNSDGTLDPLTTTHKTGFDTLISSFIRQADGTTLISTTRYPSTLDEPSLPKNFGRLLANGSLDPTFIPFPGEPNLIGSGFRRLPDGKLLAWGTDGPFGSFGFGRLLVSGEIDPTFNSDDTISFEDAVPEPDGTILIISSSAQAVYDSTQLQRLTLSGPLDPSFEMDPQIASDTVLVDPTPINSRVAGQNRILKVFADGSFLYSYLRLDSNWRLVRIRPDGSVDPLFQELAVPVTTSSLPISVEDQQLGSIQIQQLVPSSVVFTDAEALSGGKILLTGLFKSIRSTSARGIVRLNSDGSVDSSFLTGGGAQWTSTIETPTFFPGVDNVEIQADGNLLITGTFEAFNGIAAPGMTSLNPNGSVDASFVSPVIRGRLDGVGGTILTRQPDGSFFLSAFDFTAPTISVVPSFIHLVGPPVIISPLTVMGTAGVPFTYQFEAQGATLLDITNLPAGLTFRADLSAITGTPMAAGVSQVGLSATNGAGTTTATLTLTVQPAPPSGPTVTSSTAVTGRAGQRFGYQVFTTGGTPAARVSASGLPPGLSIDAVTGRISGTPAGEGSSAVTLTVTDGPFTTSSILQLTFTADPAMPVITSSSSASLTPGQFFMYTITAPSSGGPSTFTVIGTLPMGLSFDGIDTISGTYTPPLRREGAKGGPPQPEIAGGTIGSIQLFGTNLHGTSTLPLVFGQISLGVVNISTRLLVETGENSLIGGFIITGTSPKVVIIRAIGPSTGVPGALEDPTLELHSAGHPSVLNDNWKDTQEQIIRDTAIPPGDDRESAIVAALDPGAYSAIVAGKDGTTGIGLVELYDLGTASVDPTGASKLGNISTRGFVDTGNNVLIGGFIIRGQTSRVIVRAIGPSLAGVQGALQDTILELRDGSGSLIFSNDDWRSTQEQEIIATTVPPTDDRESAIVATLAPGVYSAIVAGKNNTTGVGLVEAYGLGTSMRVLPIEHPLDSPAKTSLRIVSKAPPPIPARRAHRPSSRQEQLNGSMKTRGRLALP